MRGWANYDSSVVSKEIFDTLDNLLWRSLWRWAKRRYPNKSSAWVKTKYFSLYKTRNWILNKGKYILNLHSDVPITLYNKIIMETGFIGVVESVNIPA
ncbi:MAG: hypothetical protein MK289_24010 [Trichodesmium sp. ALOHA_ZT_67]|uniref:group II intron maturase-specific domain-containing protein n=1 Tax=Trichodesmium erythraeum TaxID=1206 RepID=UPI0023ADD1BA|nr:hypothetical protein [Trichodesmium sp. ALOHA_ZT_67]MDE5094256.1 hypothetical protein [Trichodesmium sp. St11_bin5]MDT9339721.1 hypothetical protein [Trichodesmium erythraeum 21-75]